MTCRTCDQALPPDRYSCPTCATPAGGPPVAPGVRTRAVRGVGVAAIVGVLAVLLLEVVTALFPLAGRAMAEQATRTGDVDLLNQAALLEGLLALPYLAAWIATGVLVISWLWRARMNLAAFPGAPRGMRAGWAITGWLIPFVNLVVPFRVTANVARASLWRQKTPAVVGIWWASYLLAGFVSVRVALTELRAVEELPTVLNAPADFQQYVDHYESAIGLRLAELGLTVVAGAALIWLIMAIGRAQEDRIARGRSGPLLPGAPVEQAPPAR